MRTLKESAMSSNLITNSVRFTSWANRTVFACVLAVVLMLGAMPVYAQTFTSGSDGSDGPYNPSGAPGTIIVFDPTQFHGSQVAANIFNFTTITIPSGVTVKLSGNTLNGPVFWLAQGDVDIEGTVDLSGGSGYDNTAQAFFRVPSVPGSGGYAGGVGGFGTQVALPGSGTGGGKAGDSSNQAGDGVFGGNHFLIPLVGGSGGGGGWNPRNDGVFNAAGGAGGGALLIASSTRIVVNGTINANGGRAGQPYVEYAGGGSGGAIRLVSNALAGSGTLTTVGGTNFRGGGGGPGIIREESTSTFFGGNVQGTLAESTPFRLLLPTAGSPSANVISINGISVTPNPNTFPDITINSGSPVPVVIQTQNVPTNAAIALTILDENNVADAVLQAPPLSNCTPSNVCTTTVEVTFPFGGSYGLTKVTWTVQ
jgi:hypothetical protein